MGTWGTGISSNDTYADLHAIFFEQYDNGREPADISAEIITANQKTIDDPDDCNNFWFALAKCQWDCKQLDPGLLTRVQGIIKSGADLEVWKHLGADEKEITKRKSALEKFLAKLESTRPKPKPRQKKIIRQPIFEAGTCLTFKLKTGNYGGVFVLSAVSYDRFGFNLLALTRINQTQRPTTDDFENANVLLMNYAGWKDEPSLGWNIHSNFKKDSDVFEIIGTIPVSKEYHPQTNNFGVRGEWKDWTVNVADDQFESEKTKPPPTKKMQLRKLIRNSKWRFW